MSALDKRSVVLGFSGGVDSSVAACLLREQGYRVLGLYLDIGDESSLKAARKTAQKIGMPLETMDIRQMLEANVCDPFAKSYLLGQTPNPCVLCNPSVKFASLIACADRCGVYYIATGHYARAEQGHILRGLSKNDQSYMLCRLYPEQIARTLLPLGRYEKEQVRALARERALPSAEKPDSMEICFIPDNDHIGWLTRRSPVPPQGPIFYDGKVIGEHQGIYRWTVGQRLPGLYNERKLYVARIDAGANALHACLWEDLFTCRFTVRDMRWQITPPDGPIKASVQVRHTRWERPDCTMTPTEAGLEVVTELPLRAPAPGQAAAFYQDDLLLGGGWIESGCRKN